MMNVEERYYFLSESQANANTARDVCSSLNGNMVTLSDFQKEIEVVRFMNQNYISGLQSVWGFYNSDYRNTLYLRSPTRPTQAGWTFWNQLGKFKLYKEATEDYNQVYYFCYGVNPAVAFSSTRGTTVTRSNCDGYNPAQSFRLYGGNGQTSRTIQLYNYWNDFAASRLWRTDGAFFHTPNIGIANSNFDQQLAFVFLPNIHVWIGARSDVNQNQWYWNNQSVVSNQSFPTASSSTCQQVAMRYYYDDNTEEWRFTTQNCNSAKAHYVCEMKFSSAVTPLECNGYSLNVSWSSGIQLSTESDWIVQIFVERRRLATVNATDGTYLINGLRENTEYFVETVLFRSSCQRIRFLQASTVRTDRLGIPSPVENAQIQNFTNSTLTNCVIEWDYDDHDLYNQSNIGYEIWFAITNMTTVEKIDFIRNTNDTFLYNVSLEDFNYGDNITFQIAVVSCQGRSNFTEVAGFCYVNRTTGSSSNPSDLSTKKIPISGAVSSSTVIVAVFAGLAGLLLVALVAIVIYKRRKGEHGGIHERTTPEIAEWNGTTSSSAVKSVSHNVTNPEIIRPLPSPTHESLKTPVPNQRFVDPVYDTSVQDTETTPVARFDLRENYVEKIQNKQHGFVTEFKVVQNLSAIKSHAVASSEVNSKKNRYKNIYPYDDRRVILSGEAPNDYVNAAFVDGYESDRRFIAAQGPKVCTIMDFWKMVWEQSVHVIVMLCNLKEKNKVKCARYWAAERMTKTFQGYKVHTKLEENLGGIIKRNIGLTEIATKQKRLITQYHMISWPDHGVPKTTSTLFNLHRMVSTAAKKQKGPILIHCSAGAGRTGTFIGMFNLMEELDDTSKVHVQKTVLKMRECRKDMVQTTDQYKFLYKLLVEKVVFPSTDLLASEVTFLSQDEKDQRIVSEFNLLSELPNPNPSSLARTQKDQSEFLETLPYDFNIISVKTEESPQPIFINASYMEASLGYTMLIAAKSPSKENEELLWKMVDQNYVSCIIALETEYSDSVVGTRVGDQLTFGNTSMYVDELKEEQNFTERILVATKNDQKISLLHLHVTSWKSTNDPPSFHTFSDVVARLMSFYGSGKGITLVHCKDGSSRTSLLMAFMMLYERLRTQNRIDVFRTVKDIRDLRPKSIETLDVYRYCYDLVHHAIKQIQTYENLN